MLFRPHFRTSIDALTQWRSPRDDARYGSRNLRKVGFHRQAAVGIDLENADGVRGVRHDIQEVVVVRGVVIGGAGCSLACDTIGIEQREAARGVDFEARDIVARGVGNIGESSGDRGPASGGTRRGYGTADRREHSIGSDRVRAGRRSIGRTAGGFGHDEVPGAIEIEAKRRHSSRCFHDRTRGHTIGNGVSGKHVRALFADDEGLAIGAELNLCGTRIGGAERFG